MLFNVFMILTFILIGLRSVGVPLFSIMVQSVPSRSEIMPMVYKSKGLGKVGRTSHLFC